MISQPATAAEQAATAHLSTSLRTGWRAVLHPSRVYRRHVRRLCPGRVLDLGCGVGRHLAGLDASSVGVDPNPASIEVARGRGLTALHPAALATAAGVGPGAFDVLLCSHVLEHLAFDDAVELVAEHLSLIRPGGRVVAICPQQRGQRADPTHVTHLPAERLVELLERAGTVVDRVRSFPLPAVAGRWFAHNETVVVAHVPAAP